ncbi:hypothetical protein PUN28_010829 [Cardiocondyla obscurior]|uniref:Ribosomal protein S14 n=1 Tax=Cardiocondyla obscurior TaxID=286306 RepID=A0AAW2FI01_9HYME
MKEAIFLGTTLRICLAEFTSLTGKFIIGINHLAFETSANNFCVIPEISRRGAKEGSIAEIFRLEERRRLALCSARYLRRAFKF